MYVKLYMKFHIIIELRMWNSVSYDVSMDMPHPWLLAWILWKKCGLYMNDYGKWFSFRAYPLDADLFSG